MRRETGEPEVKKTIKSGDRVLIESYGPATIFLDPRYQRFPGAGVLIAADRLWHRVMRGRCYNARLCEKLSYYQCMKAEGYPARRRTGTGYPR